MASAPADEQVGPISGRWLVSLAALSAIPPLTFDMYLPALPKVAADLGVSIAPVQLTLSVCLIGIVVGQILGGPASDAFGRRSPLVVGLAVNIAMSLACAVAPSFPLFMGLRFFQGVGGGVAVAIARAIVRDRTAGVRTAKVLSLIMLVSGAAPIVAPVIGGALILVTSWRGIFVLLGLIGIAQLAATAAFLPESLPPSQRRTGGFRDIRDVARRVLSDRTFLGYALTSGFGFGAMFLYISSSSFIFQNRYGLSEQQFSAVFASNALGLMVMSRINAWMLSRRTPSQILRWAVAQLLIAAATLVAALEAGFGLPLVLPLLMIAVSTNALIFPNATALAMEPFGNEAGSVSAYLGVFQFIGGAVSAPLLSAIGDTTEFTLAFGMLFMAFTAFIVSRVLVARGATTAIGADLH